MSSVDSTWPMDVILGKIIFLNCVLTLIVSVSTLGRDRYTISYKSM